MKSVWIPAAVSRGDDVQSLDTDNLRMGCISRGCRTHWCSAHLGLDNNYSSNLINLNFLLYLIFPIKSILNFIKLPVHLYDMIESDSVLQQKRWPLDDCTFYVFMRFFCGNPSSPRHRHLGDMYWFKFGSYNHVT